MSYIKAENHVVGERFRHSNRGILTVVMLNGVKFFENKAKNKYQSKYEEGEILYMI